MKLELDVKTLPPIPLRYYLGWSVEFNVQMESFQSPILSLFGFDNVHDLERAIENSVKLRNK